MPLEEIEAARRRLVDDGLLEQQGETYSTTRRWQSAMARAALRLYDSGDPGDDLRVPIATALVEIYESEVPDDVLAELRRREGISGVDEKAARPSS